MQDVDTKVLVTQPDMRRMITPIIPELFELQHILVLNKDGRDPTPLDYQDLGYEEEMSKATSRSEIVPTAQDDPAVIHYRFDDSEVATGIAQEHGAVIRHYATGKWCLDLHPDDIYWSTADPGSPVGTFDGILAPWTNGVTQLKYEGRLTAAEWYRLVQTLGVTVASTTPETVNMLMEAGNDLPGEYDLSSLRFLASGRRPARTGGRRVGERRTRTARSRQLGTRRSGRDRVLQLCLDGDPARLHRMAGTGRAYGSPRRGIQADGTRRYGPDSDQAVMALDATGLPSRRLPLQKGLVCHG